MATLGRYELSGTLGDGGFATVYRAWDPVLARQVALKALLPHLAANADVCRRFVAEARALAQLRHPSIVTFFDVDEAGGQPFFTMELLDGHTLAEHLTGGRRFTPDEVTEILRHLCSAVDYLHGAGLVHRDIKAANIMLDASGRAVLMDFGIARAVDLTAHTRTGAVLGTPEAMAPEQVRGEHVGPAADIYALGVLAYQLLAGRPPFVGDTAHVLHAHAYDPPPPLRQLAPGFTEAMYVAVDAALSKSSGARPASARAFLDIFTASGPASIGNMVEAPMSLPTVAVRPPGKAHRRRLLPAMVACVGVALFGTGIVLAALSLRSGADTAVQRAAASSPSASASRTAPTAQPTPTGAVAVETRGGTSSVISTPTAVTTTPADAMPSPAPTTPQPVATSPPDVRTPTPTATASTRTATPAAPTAVPTGTAGRPPLLTVGTRRSLDVFAEEPIDDAGATCREVKEQLRITAIDLLDSGNVSIDVERNWPLVSSIPACTINSRLEIGLVYLRLYHSDGSIQRANFIFGTGIANTSFPIELDVYNKGVKSGKMQFLVQKIESVDRIEFVQEWSNGTGNVRFRADLLRR